MPHSAARELKKSLVEAGLEIFRVRADRVHLAARVRANLIMDGRVCAVASDPPRVRFVTHVELSAFPRDAEEALIERARALGREATGRGYVEVETAVVPVPKPGSPDETLDTWYEVSFEKTTTDSELVGELRYALGLAKTPSTG